MNDAVGATLLVKYVVQTLGWKKVGLAYVKSAFGQSGSDAVKQALSQFNITPTAVQTHLDSTKEFTSQLLNFQQAGVDDVIAWTDDQSGGLLAKQRKTLDMKFGLAGSTSFSQLPFLSLAGDAANGVYAITDLIAENDSPEIFAWKKLHHDAKGETPELYSSTYYDAVNLLAWAIGEAASVSRPDIRDALTKVKDRPGVIPTIPGALPATWCNPA